MHFDKIIFKMSIILKIFYQNDEGSNSPTHLTAFCFLLSAFPLSPRHVSRVTRHAFAEYFYLYPSIQPTCQKRSSSSAGALPVYPQDVMWRIRSN